MDGNMTIEELPHTADILVRVKSGSLPDLFAESARALMGVMYENISEGQDAISIRVVADDISGLLADFLSEVLFISETERFVITRSEISLDGTLLEAKLIVEKFIPEKHIGGVEVKGISYSGLAIQKTEDGYQTDILFDV